MTIFDRNRRVYGARGVVQHYATASGLQPAEETIFERLEGELASAWLLDVGVGGGRTTAYLGPRVGRYSALDYSAEMIDAARRRFPQTAYEFILGDARMMRFAHATFDAVFFSHNGIDYVDHDDRLRILAEIRRVLRPGGLFIFSTHNLDRGDLSFAAPCTESLWLRARHGLRRARMRARNPGYERLAALDFAMINDGAFGFRASTYHIRLPSQLTQLSDGGFHDVHVYCGTSGRELEPVATSGVDRRGALECAANARPDCPWMYFTCRAAP